LGQKFRKNRQKMLIFKKIKKFFKKSVAKIDFCCLYIWKVFSEIKNPEKIPTKKHLVQAKAEQPPRFCKTPTVALRQERSPL